MGPLIRRWRAPLLGGIAVWLLSLPLLTSHPASAQKAPQVSSATAAVPMAALAAAEHRLVRQAVSAQAVAIEAARLQAAATAAQAAAAPPANPSPNTSAPARPAAPRPPVAVGANTIVVARLGLRQPVGWYSDCLGRTAVPRWGSWRWSCAGANNIYVMAHNPGTFTPILGLRAGDIVQYGDPSGRVHTYRVSYTTIVSNTQMWPLGATPSSSLTLQTCWTWDGSRDFIVRAVEF
jgi:hypothetical protein